MSILIATTGLTKRFNALTAVNRVDLTVHEGQTSGIIGPNGSGKTTLFNLLSGYFPPTEGKIMFQGQDLTRISSPKRVAMGIARTFQLVSVFTSLTVWENLVLSNARFNHEETKPFNFFMRNSRRKTIMGNCERALDWVGLTQKADVATAELSYGDKRLLELAIVLSLEPKLLLLDEPLAGLSDHEITQVLELIQRVKQRLTVVIIEHKISKIVDLINQLNVMNEGRLICEGSPEQVLADERVRECYWGKEQTGA